MKKTNEEEFVDTDEEKIIDQQVEKMGNKCAPEEKDQFRQILGDVVTKGLSIMEAIKFPPGLVELIFSYANDLYSAGKYEDANKLYYFVVQLNPKDPRFPFAYAASFHKLKKFNEAAGFYLISGNSNPEDPLPWFHCADCYIQMHELDVAKVMLEKTIMVAQDSLEHEKIKQQAAGLISAIENSQGGPS